jgi:CRISPR/Cas system CMR-associated protein Cmr5 small subunit
MIELTKLTELVKTLEVGIEKRFSSQVGYQQVKAVLQGKTKKIDAPSLIIESKAVFAGENRPELVALGVADVLQKVVTSRISSKRERVDSDLKTLGERVEKTRAVMENRASVKKYAVSKEEAAVSGRLVMDDGKTPVAGARVMVHGTGDDYAKIVAEGVTDANGEYVIKMDKHMVSEAPAKVTLAFNTPKGENIAHSAEVSLKKGKVLTVDNNVKEEMKDAASPLTKSAEEMKTLASFEMASIKRSKIELEQYDMQAEDAARSVATAMDQLKKIIVG